MHSINVGEELVTLRVRITHTISEWPRERVER